MKLSINLDFSDMEPFTIPFQVNGKNYELREPTCLAKKKYTNERLSRITFNKGAVTSVRDLGDLEPLLVSLCTFEEGAKKHVDVSLVESWPGRITSKLFEAAKTIAFEKDQDDLPIVQLLEALSKETSAPISKKDFLDWVESLSDKYTTLKSSVGKEELDPKELLNITPDS